MAEAEATAQEWPIGFRSLQGDRKKHGTKRRPLWLQRRMHSLVEETSVNQIVREVGERS